MNLKPGLLEFLQQPENQAELRDILLYHILPGQTATSDFQAGPTKTLLDGETVLVGLNPLSFGTSTVGRKDVPACNGLYNVLDAVLDPCKPKSIGHCCDFTRKRFHALIMPLFYFLNALLFSYCVTYDEEPFRSTSRGIDGVADGIHHTSDD